MLTAVLWFAGVLLIGLGFDWFACTRIAAYRTQYEYRYRPRTLRFLLLMAAAAVFAYAKVTYNPSRQPITGLLILGGILLAWGLVAARDVNRELVPIDLAPKRYSGTDY